MIRSAIIVAFFATPAVAAEHEVATYGVVLEECYAAAADTEALEACVGRMSEICMNAEADGYTTVGTMFCMMAEAEVWDRYLNAEYKTTMNWARESDAQEATRFPEFATRADSIRAAQRAWIAFRDAECGMEYALWGSGSMRQIAGASCRVDMVASRTMDLISIREMMK